MMPIEEAIVETLQRSGPCCLDEIVTYLPNFSWGEVFLAVDRMSRDGRVSLRQLGYSDLSDHPPLTVCTPQFSNGSEGDAI